MHICYGYGIKANIDWKKTLGAEWRQYEETFPLLARSAIRQVSLECANSRVPIELIGLLDGKDVLVGAIDVATDRIETPEDVASTIRSALRYVPAERLYPCTNCGMVPLAREIARAKLRALGAGAALVRAELAAPVDPAQRTVRPACPAHPGRPRGQTGAPGTSRDISPLAHPQKTTSARGTSCVSSAKCFSFKAVSTPCTTALQSFHRRSFLEIETLAGTFPDFFFVREEFLKWQLEL